MSAKATTFMFAVSLLRKQQQGVRLFRNYEEIVRLLAGDFLTNEVKGS